MQEKCNLGTAQVPPPAPRVDRLEEGYRAPTHEPCSDEAAQTKVEIE